jgi:hypothetical protein
LAIAAAFSASMFSAHAENAVSDTARVEFLQRIHLFAGGDQLDRLAGDGAHRKRGAAAAVTIHACQDETGDADTFVEGAGEVDGVLTGQRIGDEQDFVRIGLFPDVGHFDHQRLVNMRAAGGIENDNVMAAELGSLHGARGDLDRCLAGDDRQRVDAGLHAELA